MAIDYSFLDDIAPKPKEEVVEVKSDTANVTIRVDADCMMLCDGEFMDFQFKAGAITKVQLPTGQHLLEFLSEENPNVKVEKVVDFPEPNKNYLVILNELNAAISKHQTDVVAALATKKTYSLTVTSYENQMGAMMVARAVLGWSSNESREKLSNLPAVLIQSEDLSRIQALANQFAQRNVNVSIETRNGLGELINTSKQGIASHKIAEAKPNTKEDAKHYSNIADDYRKGSNGKVQDYAEAVKWYRKAADLGYSYAQARLGQCFCEGLGVEKDFSEAIYWCKKAAEQDDVFGMRELSVCYSMLKRNPFHDYKEAIKWGVLAAEHGDAWAAFWVGIIYEQIEKYCPEISLDLPSGTTVSDEKKKWYSKAAAAGLKAAKDKLKELD